MQNGKNIDSRRKFVDSFVSASIVSLLEKEGLSKRQIGEAMGLSRSYVSLVRNRRRSLTMYRLKKLEQFLKRPLPLLLLQAIETKDVPKELKSEYDLLRKILSEGVKEVDASWSL